MLYYMYIYVIYIYVIYMLYYMYIYVIYIYVLYIYMLYIYIYCKYYILICYIYICVYTCYIYVDIIYIYICTCYIYIYMLYIYIYIVNGGSSQSRILQSDTCHNKFQAAASQASFDHADPTAISGRPRPPSCYALWLQGSYALPTLHLTTGSLSLRFLRHFKLNWRWMNAS